MHSHSRRTLLSQLLVLQPGREVTRDVVEAAIWQTVGWDTDPRYIGRLLSVVDAYVDVRVKRMIAHATGGSPPDYTAFGMPDRAAAEALAGISRSGIARPQGPPLRAVLAPLPPQPRNQPGHPDIITDDDEPEDPGEFLRRAFEKSGGVTPFSENNDDDDDDGIGSYATRDDSDPSSDTSLRRCTACKAWLPFTEFWKNVRGPKGYDWQCRSCKNMKKKLRGV